ncbi:MAG TPA: AAA family ATPase [Mycobacteriales bacterium]|nr:AAA family ATPase [Mycobacteriales bacterium]
MSCPACGTSAVPGARFCFHCGTALSSATAGPPEVSPEVERRIVTVLFADLSDFTAWSEDLDPERVGVVTDRLLAGLTGAVAEYGGHVDKLTGDGLMAIFGAPLAHEDDTERAVRAAAGMQESVRQLVEDESGGGMRLGLRVGLNTGEVLAGIQAHLSYTVVGDAVNTAARLSDAAGIGSVYAGRDTALATMAVASWRSLPPLRLKGKRERVPAYELVALRPPGATRLGLGDEAPFLGRDAELAQLAALLDQTTALSHPHTVLLSGEAGVGKTRLAQELARRGGGHPDLRVLWGRCAPYGEGRDLGALAEMVRTACGVTDADGAEQVRAKIARTVERLGPPDAAPPAPASIGQRLAALLGLEAAEAPPLRDAAAPGAVAAAADVREAVAGLFTALAGEAPLILVVDDVHWATPSLLEGLREVLAAVSGGVLLLCLGRPDMLTVADGWWQHLPAVELLPVLPLGDADSEGLLRAYLGGPAEGFDEQVRASLLARAQGNPFFLAELLHLLVDRGHLRREADSWVLQAAAPDQLLPAGVQSVLAARIDDLGGAAKGVLRDAAVLGLRVTPGGLAAVGRASAHGDPEVVARALDLLVERRLLEPDGDAGVEPAYRFSHTLVRDVAYAGLAKAERARRHAAAAVFAFHPEAARPEALSAGPSRHGEADLLAASQGEQAIRLAAEMQLPPEDPAWAARTVAFAALSRLGRAALTRDDYRAADEVLTRALELLAETSGAEVSADDVIAVRLARAEALVAMHRLDEAESDLAGPLASTVEGVRTPALVVLGDIQRRRGDIPAARRSFVSALAAAGAAGIERITGEALRRLGMLDHFDGRLRAAEERFQQSYDLARQVGDDRGAGWALQHVAWSATTRGDYALADRALEDAAEVFTRLADTGGLSWVAGTGGFVRLLQGRLREARELAGSVLPLGEAIPQGWGVAVLLTIDALAAAELGELDTATAAAERARARFAELDDAWGESLALVAAGTAARGAGRLDEAVQLLSTAVQRSEGGSHPVTACLALLALGYAQLERGELAAATADAHRAELLVSALELEPQAGFGVKTLRAQIATAGGDFATALDLLLEVTSATDCDGLLFPRRRALAHLSGVLLALGRVEEARAAAREAVDLPSEDSRSQVLAVEALRAADLVSSER